MSERDEMTEKEMQELQLDHERQAVKEAMIQEEFENAIREGEQAVSHPKCGGLMVAVDIHHFLAEPGVWDSCCSIYKCDECGKQIYQCELGLPL